LTLLGFSLHQLNHLSLTSSSIFFSDMDFILLFLIMCWIIMYYLLKLLFVTFVKFNFQLIEYYFRCTYKRLLFYNICYSFPFYVSVEYQFSINYERLSKSQIILRTWRSNFKKNKSGRETKNRGWK
jgi:hypothetical protein